MIQPKKIFLISLFVIAASLFIPTFLVYAQTEPVPDERLEARVERVVEEKEIEIPDFSGGSSTQK